MLLLFLPSSAAALKCECSDCMPTGSCETSGACYIRISRTEKSQIQVSRGCVASDDVATTCGDQSKSNILCCRDNHCNGAKSADGREIRAAHDGNRTNTITMEMTTGASSNSSQYYRQAAIITAIVCIVVMTTAVSLVLSLVLCYVCCCRGNRRVRRRTLDVEIAAADSRIGSFGSYGNDCCEAMIPQGQTLESLVQASHNMNQHSSSLSLLIQRTIVRHTSLEKNLENGQFCDVFVGLWRRERVTVKIYRSKYENLWFRETEMYQIPHMRHECLQSFIAADITQKNSQTHHYLITQHQEHGSLYHYLQSTVLDVFSAVMMAHSVASGLAYLHSEVSSEHGTKPVIAHRNLTSRSVYVKDDGTCCIADLSLAVKNDGNLTSELLSQPWGSPRYLAPEFLAEYGGSQWDIDKLRRGDMYSYGLVLWELARRCAVQGMVEDAELPYSDVTHSDPPSMEEMREIICTQQHRPLIPDQWNRDESLRLILRTTTECWHQDSTVRLTALRVKKTLEKLSSSIKPIVDKNGKVRRTMS